MASLVEEEEVCFYPCPRLREDSTGQADDAVQVTFIQQLSLGLYKGCFIGSEEQPFIYYNPCSTAVLKAVYDLL